MGPPSHLWKARSREAIRCRWRGSSGGWSRSGEGGDGRRGGGYDALVSGCGPGWRMSVRGKGASFGAAVGLGLRFVLFSLPTKMRGLAAVCDKLE